MKVAKLHEPGDVMIQFNKQVNVMIQFNKQVNVMIQFNKQVNLIIHFDKLVNILPVEQSNTHYECTLLSDCANSYMFRPILRPSSGVHHNTKIVVHICIHTTYEE